jgi:transcriptional regulator NrdR family protein
MNCPRCNRPSSVLRTEPGAFNSVRRHHRCEGDHHFATVEVYEPQGTNIE